jgi:hypothetical protein
MCDHRNPMFPMKAPETFQQPQEEEPLENSNNNGASQKDDGRPVGQTDDVPADHGFQRQEVSPWHSFHCIRSDADPAQPCGSEGRGSGAVSPPYVDHDADQEATIERMSLLSSSGDNEDPWSIFHRRAETPTGDTDQAVEGETADETNVDDDGTDGRDGISQYIFVARMAGLED